jgi:hypothetical protein
VGQVVVDLDPTGAPFLPLDLRLPRLGIEGEAVVDPGLETAAEGVTPAVGPDLDHLRLAAERLGRGVRALVVGAASLPEESHGPDGNAELHHRVHDVGVELRREIERRCLPRDDIA